MKKECNWSVDVPMVVRKLVKVKARESGVSIGDWLIRAIESYDCGLPSDMKEVFCDLERAMSSIDKRLNQIEIDCKLQKNKKGWFK